MKKQILLATATVILSQFSMFAAVPDLKPEPETRYKWVGDHSDECLRLSKIFKEKDNVFLGDSITWGWRDITANGGSKVWRKYFDGKSLNFGISGDCIEHVLWRITEGKQLDGCKFKNVILMIGTNNILEHKKRNQTMEHIVHGNLQIINIIKQKQPQAKILLLSIPPTNWGPAVDKMSRDVNPELIKLADNKTVFFVDLNPIFLDANGKVINTTDGVHPTAAGYQKMAEIIDAALKKINSPANGKSVK